MTLKNAPCVEVCSQEAWKKYGDTWTVEEVVREVEKDAVFYETSGGGVTLTGGDPLCQKDFALAILKECKRKRISTAIETCGYAPWKDIAKLLEYTDAVLYDLKHIDPRQHQEHTGESNKLILENMKKIAGQNQLALIPRIPVIPGFNDSTADLIALAEFIASRYVKEPVHLLPFHKLAKLKYESLGIKWCYQKVEALEEKDLKGAIAIFHSHGLEVIIGG